MSFHFWTGTTGAYRYYWKLYFNPIYKLLEDEGYKPFPYEDYLVMVGIQFYRHGLELRQWADTSGNFHRYDNPSMFHPGDRPERDLNALHDAVNLHQHGFSRLL